MDKVKSPETTSNKRSSGIASPETFRFRVDRVNSLAAGHHRSTGTPCSLNKTSADQIGSVIIGGSSSPYVTAYPLHFQPPSPASSADTAELISPSREAGSGGATRRYSKQREVPTEATMAERPTPQRKFSLAGILGRKRSSNLPQLEDFHQNQGTVGLYGKSLYRYTQEALPKMENYKDAMSIKAMHRPTIDELHEAAIRKKVLI